MATLEDVRWASNDITLPLAGVANKLDVTTAIKDNGYDKSQKPTASTFNFWRNAVYEWIVELDSRTTAALQLETVYPVGSIYMNASESTNPATFFGIGTWTRIGQGRVLVGEGTGADVNGAQQTFNSGDTGGEYEHTLTVDEMPNHNHQVTIGSSVGDGSGALENRQPGGGTTFTSTSAGGSQAHNNIQPYLTVYMWQRVA